MWIAKMKRYSNNLLMYSIAMNKRKANLIIILKIIKNLILIHFKNKALLLRRKSRLINIFHNSNNKMCLFRILRRLLQYKSSRIRSRTTNFNPISRFKQLTIRQTDQPPNFKAKMFSKGEIQQQETWTVLNLWAEAEAR